MSWIIVAAAPRLLTVRGRALRSRLSELREDAVEVRADRAVGEAELLADLAVGEAFGGEVSDLEFLRRGLVAGGGVAPPARLS